MLTWIVYPPEAEDSLRCLPVASALHPVVSSHPVYAAGFQFWTSSALGVWMCNDSSYKLNSSAALFSSECQPRIFPCWLARNARTQTFPIFIISLGGYRATMTTLWIWPEDDFNYDEMIPRRVMSPRLLEFLRLRKKMVIEYLPN